MMGIANGSGKLVYSIDDEAELEIIFLSYSYLANSHMSCDRYSGMSHWGLGYSKWSII